MLTAAVIGVQGSLLQVPHGSLVTQHYLSLAYQLDWLEHNGMAVENYLIIYLAKDSLSTSDI